MPCRATLGERVCDRVLANAVGRRGLFPEGRGCLQISKMSPLRKRTERGREATPKAGDGEQAPGQQTASTGRVRNQGRDQKSLRTLQ